ncbi:MAG: PAS domain-containing sensor histidine kinase [Geobacteraceae bacterium GWC2_58_44]|nr:MAG: PAS domain-containing sensor histidine kinase [Geobacteraceae bacterium GWC2_58_44]HBG08279.1 PAS domain-containing sensor histidine kinase [Geobacter sp.]
MKLKVIAAQLLIFLLLGAVIYGHVNRSRERYQATEMTEHLINDAALARLVAARSVGDLRRDAQALAASISGEIKARTTVIASSGEVLGDSEIPSAELAGLDNHAGRPEVREALAKGVGSSVRYSETLRTDMLYVALPFRSAAGDRAVLRLALSLSSLEAAKQEFQAVLWGSLLLAALLVAFFSYILSSFSTRSLHAVAAIASRIGKGELGTRVPIESGSEVGELARVLNEMAERTEAQLERISAERNRLDTILRGMGEGIMVTDPQGVITLVNPAFRELFALQEEVEGKQLIDISRHPALHESFREVLALGQERVEELQLRLAREKTVFTHWVPLLENGVLQGVVAVFHDISDIRQLEKIRRDFVANVSHELRTPVTIIKGYAETLLAGALENPGQAARFVGIMHSHADRLASLIGDLLTLSQLESGTLGLESRSVSLHDIAQHVVALLEPKIQERRITVDSSGLIGAPAVLADPGRLEQVFVNLLDNAVKYTPAGGSVTLGAQADGDQARISVKDTGIGIPSRDLPRIFERFYRVDSARSRDEGGTGLGLAIVKHMVQLQGGTVSVESSGQGSTFYVTLKRA